MREPPPPRNRDQDVPLRSGEEIGEREPLIPQPDSERKDQDHPLDREERRPDEEKPPVED